jgi:hypothetical protein
MKEECITSVSLVFRFTHPLDMHAQVFQRHKYDGLATQEAPKVVLASTHLTIHISTA